MSATKSRGRGVGGGDGHRRALTAIAQVAARGDLAQKILKETRLLCRRRGKRAGLDEAGAGCAAA